MQMRLQLREGKSGRERKQQRGEERRHFANLDMCEIEEPSKINGATVLSKMPEQYSSTVLAVYSSSAAAVSREPQLHVDKPSHLFSDHC